MEVDGGLSCGGGCGTRHRVVRQAGDETKSPWSEWTVDDSRREWLEWLDTPPVDPEKDEKSAAVKIAVVVCVLLAALFFIIIPAICLWKERKHLRGCCESGRCSLHKCCYPSTQYGSTQRLDMSSNGMSMSQDATMPTEPTLTELTMPYDYDDAIPSTVDDNTDVTSQNDGDASSSTESEEMPPPPYKEAIDSDVYMRTEDLPYSDLNIAYDLAYGSMNIDHPSSVYTDEELPPYDPKYGFGSPVCTDHSGSSVTREGTTSSNHRNTPASSMSFIDAENVPRVQEPCNANPEALGTDLVRSCHPDNQSTNVSSDMSVPPLSSPHEGRRPNDDYESATSSVHEHGGGEYFQDRPHIHTRRGISHHSDVHDDHSTLNQSSDDHIMCAPFKTPGRNESTQLSDSREYPNTCMSTTALEYGHQSSNYGNEYKCQFKPDIEHQFPLQTDYVAMRQTTEESHTGTRDPARERDELPIVAQSGTGVSRNMNTCDYVSWV